MKDKMEEQLGLQLAVIKDEIKELVDKGHYKQAISHFSSRLVTQKKELGEDHPEFLRSVDFLSDLLKEWGEVKQATALLIWAMTPPGHEPYSIEKLGEGEDSAIEYLWDIIQIEIDKMGQVTPIC